MWHGWKRCNTPQCSDCLPCCTCLKSQPDSHCQLQAGALSFGKPYFWMERTAVGGVVDARQTTVTVETVWAACGCKGVPGKAKTQTPCGSALPGWQAAAGCQLDPNRSLHHVDTGGHCITLTPRMGRHLHSIPPQNVWISARVTVSTASPALIPPSCDHRLENASAGARWCPLCHLCAKRTDSR